AETGSGREARRSAAVPSNLDGRELRGGACRRESRRLRAQGCGRGERGARDDVLAPAYRSRTTRGRTISRATDRRSIRGRCNPLGIEAHGSSRLNGGRASARRLHLPVSCFLFPVPYSIPVSKFRFTRVTSLLRLRTGTRGSPRRATSPR